MSFENLDVWKEAIKFAQIIYRITKGFPDTEKFGNISQLRRAAVSIACNIAEGAGRGGRKDFIHFINIAFGSLNEVLTLLVISRNEEYLDPKDYPDLKKKADHIARMLSDLRKSLE